MDRYFSGWRRRYPIFLIHAVATVSLRADHIISGTVINLMAPALGVFLIKAWYGKGQTDNITQNLGIFLSQD